MTNKLKRIVIIRIAVVVLIIVAAAIAGTRYIGGGSSKITYKTASVTRADLESTIQATGTLQPVETVDVGTQISGKIIELYIDYNTVVKKGDIIALMDPSTQAADVAQSEATLASCEADVLNSEAALDVAEKDLMRTKTLVAKDLVAKSQLDKDTSTYLKAKASLAASRAKVKQARAALEKTSINLGYTKIVSPVDGIIISKSVEKGQTVAASYQTPSIAKIARNLKEMQVEVLVDEADIGSVKEGMAAEFTVDTFQNEKFTGRVTQVRLSPTTSNNVVTYTVIVTVDNSDLKLLPGLTTNVSLIIEKRDNVLAVPNSAFRFKPAEKSKQESEPGPRGPRTNVAEVTAPTLYTLDKKGRPQKHEVEKGITSGVLTEVVSGIDEGAKVITGINVPKEGK